MNRSYLEMGNMHDAEELLLKALEMTQLYYGEEDINCASIMTLLANCSTKINDYDQALNYISKVEQTCDYWDSDGNTILAPKGTLEVPMVHPWG